MNARRSHAPNGGGVWRWSTNTRGVCSSGQVRRLTREREPHRHEAGQRRDVEDSNIEGFVARPRLHPRPRRTAEVILRHDLLGRELLEILEVVVIGEMKIRSEE